MLPRRYVAYSVEHGALLGLGPYEAQSWSGLCSACDGMDALTFTDKQELEEFVSRNSSSGLPEYELKMVTPDRPDNKASQAACESAGLRWRNPHLAIGDL